MKTKALIGYREAGLRFCFRICKMLVFSYKSFSSFLHKNNMERAILKHIYKLDLMFMKHYAPNRCLYIKVAKLKMEGECRDKIPVSNYSKSTSKSKSAKGDNLKKIKITFFFLFSPIDLLIILYQLTKFEAPSCYSFRDIMYTNFQSPNLQREIIKKK